VSATVLYDENCRFCRRSIDWIRALARGDSLAFAPIGSEAGEQLLRDLSPDERYASWHLVDEDGRRYSAGAAFSPLLRRLPALRWLAPVTEAFPAATESAYRLVSRHRGRLSRLVGGHRR
jgi:predicted DCC family thiol-disulfide oxidoreductase YuxK